MLPLSPGVLKSFAKIGLVGCTSWSNVSDIVKRGKKWERVHKRSSKGLNYQSQYTFFLLHPVSHSFPCGRERLGNYLPKNEGCEISD